MADYDTTESLHSLDSSLNNHQQTMPSGIDIQLPDFTKMEAEEKKNDDDDETTLHPDFEEQQHAPMGDPLAMSRVSGGAINRDTNNNILLTLPPLGHENYLKSADNSAAVPQVSAGTQMHTNRPEHWRSIFQQPRQEQERDNMTLDSDSIYTNGNQQTSITSPKIVDVEAKSTPSKDSEETTKGGTDTLTPSVVTPSNASPARAEEEAGSYMSVEVIEPPTASPNADTPKIGYGKSTADNNSQGPMIQVVEHNNNNNNNTTMDEKIQDMVNAQMNMPPAAAADTAANATMPKQATMVPPNMVTCKEPKSPTTNRSNPFQVEGSNASTDGSLYTAGHDASTITKDTFLKQQDYLQSEQERQAYAEAERRAYAHAYDQVIVNPEAPHQEATPDYDAYYDPNAYGLADDEPSIGHSTITSLTKDTGILRTELPSGMIGEDVVSDLSPARYRTQHKPGTPSTFESGVLKDDDEEYGEVTHNQTKDEPGSMWIFLQNATRDPTVQCLISLACIFAVILFFLVAVIIVLTSEDIQI